MKKIKILIVLLAVSIMAGCSSNVNQDVIPFSTANWESTTEDIISIEGREPDEEAKAQTGGMSYVFYNEKYGEYEGLIRYFTDENGILTMARFDIIYDDTEKLHTDYDKFIEEKNNQYGESDYSMDETEGASGEVWHSDKGNVSVSRFELFGTNMIMLAYASPSNEEQ